jgi:thioredoxin 1
MKIIEITDDNFEDIVLKANKAVLVDFSAEWCGPWKLMTPVVNLLAEKLEDVAIIGKLDVDSNPNTTARYGVRNMPTFLMFRNGELSDRVVGAVPGSLLEQKVHALSRVSD